MRAFLLALPVALAACQAEAPDTAAVPDDVPVSTAAPSVAAPEPTGAAAGPTPLNLNTASEAEFAALPGVGERMAHEFEEYRPYTSVRVFREEIGKYINDDPEQLAAYERLVFVPVDPNTSDAETVQQLPGLNADAARQLVDGRPYDSDDAFLARYAELAPGADLDAARVYLGR